MSTHNKIIELLNEKRDELEARLEALKADATPLDKSSKEAAIELENEEVKEELDREAREELEQIYQALDRIKIGTYGLCLSCQQPIPAKRLEAVPFATECIQCREERMA